MGSRKADQQTDGNRWMSPTGVSGQAGFSLIQVMVVMALITYALMALIKLSLTYKSQNLQAKNIEYLEQVRSNIINVINHDVAWLHVITNHIACVNTGTDCRGHGNAISLYNADGTDFYMAADPTAGFTKQGRNCDTYGATGGNCSYRFDLNWRAICPPAGSCLNPEIEVTGELDMERELFSNYPLNVNRFNFTLIRNHCEVQDTHLPFAVLGDVAATDTAVTPTVATATFPIGSATTANPLLGCRRTNIEFMRDMIASPFNSEVQNQSRVCFFNSAAPGVCIYEWRQSQLTWNLFARGALVYTRPPTVGFAPTTIYRFKRLKGEMHFYVNDALIYSFNESFFDTLMVRFEPSSARYSPNGFQNINFSY